MRETYSSNRTKNPCKLCGKKVSKKNGIQCKGKCQSWVHFSCLHYDSQKINDIKSGVIKILCPCPACTNIKNVQASPDGPKNHQITQCQKDAFATATQHEFNHGPNENKIPLKSFVINEEDSKESVYVAHSSYADVAKNRNAEQVRGLKKCQPNDEVPAEGKYKTLGTACINCLPTGPYATKTCCEVLSTSVSSLDARPKKRGHSQSLLNALENVCHTVGLLSNQIRDLMTKMANKQTTKAWNK